VDLPSYLRVLWRFRLLVAVGLVLAIGLAFISAVKVSVQGTHVHLSARGKQTWASYARLLVTRPGSDWAFALPHLAHHDPQTSDVTLDEQRQIQDRLTSFAILYARLADSDQMRSILAKGGPLGGKYETAPLPATDGSQEVLPVISVAGLAQTPAQSERIAHRVAGALEEYVAEQQRANGVDPSVRVVLEPIQRSGDTTRLVGPSKALPLVVFMTILTAVLGLAFILENLRPRVRAVSASPESPIAKPKSVPRRSAVS
jgi:hypothetical protein